MFIAHLPAGYLLSRNLGKRFETNINPSWLMVCGLIGSLFPDIDLIWLYWFDAHPQHHHTYWTHLPVFWLVALAVVLDALWFRGSRRAFACVLMFGANVMLHLVLDSWVGDIWWLYPAVDRPFSLFHVPADGRFWLVTFTTHWSFSLELLIVVCAFWAWRKANRAKLSAATQHRYVDPGQEPDGRSMVQ